MTRGWMRIHYQNMPCEPKVQHIHIHLMGPILIICLCHGHIACVNQLRQNRLGQWLGCVGGGLTERRGIIWHGRWIMASAPEKWKIGIFNSTSSKTGMHVVMTTQCAVKDSWSGRQVWWCPSTLTTKLLQWQSLGAKQDTGKSCGHQTRRCKSSTDHVKDLRSMGNVGICTQPVPH